MLWALIVLLLILWALGLLSSVGGSFVNLLLVIAVIVFLYELVNGRRPPL